MSGRADLPPKYVSATQNYTFDFAGDLAEGETISTQAVTASVYSGTDSSPSSIVDGAAAADGTIVTQLITAGTEGVIYLLTCTITTSSGQTLVQTGLLAIIPGSS